MSKIRRSIAIAFATVCLSASASAQQSGTPAATVVAIPPLATPDSGQKANQSLAIAWQATQMIASDLGTTSELMPLPPSQKDFYSYPEVTAPSFTKWRSAGAKTLVTGFVQSRSDGRLTFGCYVYDIEKGRELARKGFVVAGDEWRRAAHKCSGLAYTAVTGAPGIFDTRIAYVAESGSGDGRSRRIAIMDSDGFDHKYVTGGQAIVLTPRLSPKAARLAYVSFAGGQPGIRLLDLDTGNERPLLAAGGISFAPRFSPDGSRIVFSMMNGTNADIYVASASGGIPQRLTSSPGIDTDPSFSPDGTRIVFESDRSGTPQLYVMSSDGTGQRRLTFGNGWYAAPDWSPDGQWIAYTRRGSDGRRIGVIGSDGTGERTLTTGPRDEGPNWAASSRDIVFQRTDALRRNQIYRISIDGGEARKLETPQDGADPDWSGVMD